MTNRRVANEVEEDNQSTNLVSFYSHCFCFLYFFSRCAKQLFATFNNLWEFSISASFLSSRRYLLFPVTSSFISWHLNSRLLICFSYGATLSFYWKKNLNLKGLLRANIYSNNIQTKFNKFHTTISILHYKH